MNGLKNKALCQSGQQKSAALHSRFRLVTNWKQHGASAHRTFQIYIRMQATLQCMLFNEFNNYVLLRVDLSPKISLNTLQFMFVSTCFKVRRSWKLKEGESVLSSRTDGQSRLLEKSFSVKCVPVLTDIVQLVFLRRLVDFQTRFILWDHKRGQWVGTPGCSVLLLLLIPLQGTSCSSN